MTCFSPDCKGKDRNDLPSYTGKPPIGMRLMAISAWPLNTLLMARICPARLTLIELHITERWQTVDLEFMFFVNRLPMEVIFERPSLCLQSAWMYVISGQMGRILPFVEAAEQQLAKTDRKPEPTDDANRAFAKTLHAYLADFQNQPVALGQLA